MFWNIVMDKFPIELSVHCNVHSHDDFTNVLLGGPCDYITDLSLHIAFLVIAINVVHMMKTV